MGDVYMRGEEERESIIHMLPEDLPTEDTLKAMDTRQDQLLADDAIAYSPTFHTFFRHATCHIETLPLRCKVALMVLDQIATHEALGRSYLGTHATSISLNLKRHIALYNRRMPYFWEEFYEAFLCHTPFPHLEDYYYQVLKVCSDLSLAIHDIYEWIKTAQRQLRQQSSTSANMAITLAHLNMACRIPYPAFAIDHVLSITACDPDATVEYYDGIEPS